MFAKSIGQSTILFGEELAEASKIWIAFVDLIRVFFFLTLVRTNFKRLQHCDGPRWINHRNAFSSVVTRNEKLPDSCVLRIVLVTRAKRFARPISSPEKNVSLRLHVDVNILSFFRRNRNVHNDTSWSFVYGLKSNPVRTGGRGCFDVTSRTRSPSRPPVVCIEGGA